MLKIHQAVPHQPMPQNQDPAFYSKFWETRIKDDHTISAHQILKRGEEKLENFQESRLMVAE
jgi:hypothetical protein